MLTLQPLPAFSDNYIWVLHDAGQAWVVDPGDARPVLDYLSANVLKLQGVLLTHHHADHTGGVEELRKATGAVVYGPAFETLPEPVIRVSQGSVVEMLGTEFEVIDVPGHTAGHVAYWAHPADDSPVLFCGDTLFSGGCGRLFEGTPAQMLASLDRLSQLPSNTRVCCAHEYTLSNLRFARAVEPDNLDLQAYSLCCEALRHQGLPTVPSELGTEWLINPFLRSRADSVKASVLRRAPSIDPDEVSIFRALREWKNDFR